MINLSNKIVLSDIREIINAKLPWKEFDGCNILITGINSMIGTYLVYFFDLISKEIGINCKIYGLTRTIDKSKELFRGINDNLIYIVQDVTEPIKTDVRFDYIFHFAGNASPKAIINTPADVVDANVKGAYNVLDLALKNRPKRLVFASTREVYGKSEVERLTEHSFGSIDTMEPRSCYPESKRAVETLLNAYYLQYHIPSQCIRIAHSYGPGMKLNDGRVMSDLIGDAVSHRDIILKSTGEAERAFIYLSDTVKGILTIALLGENGKAYNLSNETEETKIRDIAEFIANQVGVSVKYELNDSNNGYCNYKRVGLDNSMIALLGFSPSVNLKDGIIRTLESFCLNT